MSLGSQFRRLNRQVATFRQELFGTDEKDEKVRISYNRGEREGIEGYYQFVKRRYLTQESGAVEQQGAIVRWSKDYDFTPEMQKQISFKDTTGRELTFVIEDFLGSHVASVEWVLGCRLLT